MGERTTGGASVLCANWLTKQDERMGERQVPQRAGARLPFHVGNGGDMPSFEEAARALFANDQSRLRELVAAWPEDVRDHAIELAFGMVTTPADNTLIGGLQTWLRWT